MSELITEAKSIVCGNCRASITVGGITPQLLRGKWSGSCRYDLHHNCKSPACYCPCHPYYDQERVTAHALARAELEARRYHRPRCRNSSYAPSFTGDGDVHGLGGDSVAADIMQYMESDIAEYGIDGDSFYGIGFGGGEY